MEKHQVAIVGAGPAGASCAKALHEAGIQALIIEKESLPRHKTCSGVLFGQTQELLQQFFGALPPEDIYCEPKTIHASQIIEWKHEQGFIQYFWEIPKNGHAFPQTYFNAWRNKFDHWLVKQSGAALRENCLFRGFTAEQEQIRVDVFLRGSKILEPGGKGDPNRTIQCDYLVGADGSASAVRRALTPDAWAATPEVIYYQEYCPITDMGTLREGCWHVFFEKSVGEMLCCVHRKDDCLVPCVGSFRGGDLRACMEAFKGFLRENFRVQLGPQERVEGVVIKMWQPDLGRGRVLLAGEAGGFRYLNDEGIDAAMDSGYRCGLAIARALHEGGDALEMYRAATADIVSHMEVCTQQGHFLVD
jgi:flavin-dependent dehydrogenase